jgi:hypothetical protein
MGSAHKRQDNIYSFFKVKFVITRQLFYLLKDDGIVWPLSN